MDLTPEARAAQDKGPMTIAVISTVNAVSLLFVIARIFVRVRWMKSFGLDDYFICLAQLCACLTVAITSVAASNGSGKHLDAMTPQEAAISAKYTVVAFCPGILSYSIPKLAVVALLTKLLNPSHMHRVILWFTAGLTVLLSFGCVINIFARCTPSRKQWDPSVPGTCWDNSVIVNYAIFAGSAAMDLYLAIYPAVVLSRLQMNLRKKIALSVALGMGAVAAGVSAYKCSRLPGLASPDFTWKTADLVIWTCVEASMIIIGACIPVLQPLAKAVTNRSLFSSDGLSNHYNKKHAPYGSHQERVSGIPLAGGLEQSRRARMGKGAAWGRAHRESSEESILRDDTSLGLQRDQGTQKHVKRPNDIVRVDELTVSSELGDAGPKRDPTSQSWYFK